MTNKEIKDWLYIFRDNQKLMRCRLDEIDRLKEKCATVRSGSASILQPGKATNKQVSSTTENGAMRIIDKYTVELDELCIGIFELELKTDPVKKEINTIFEKTDMSVQEYDSIIYYYFEGMCNREVAYKMGYCEDYIYELKRSAVKKIADFKTSHENPRS